MAKIKTKVNKIDNSQCATFMLIEKERKKNAKMNYVFSKKEWINFNIDDEKWSEAKIIIKKQNNKVRY